MSGQRRRVVAILLVGVICCASCARYTTIADATLASVELSTGDIVRVTTIDGERTEFRLVGVTEDALVGHDYEVALSDVAYVERVHPRTWILVLVALAGFYTAVEATGGHWGGSWQ